MRVWRELFAIQSDVRTDLTIQNCHGNAALAVAGVRLHLYEKHLPRRGRKMGHLSGIGATVEEAVARVIEAKAKL